MWMIIVSGKTNCMKPKNPIGFGFPQLLKRRRQDRKDNGDDSCGTSVQTTREERERERERETKERRNMPC